MVVHGHVCAEWLALLIEHVLGPWRYRLGWRIDWQGDAPDRPGSIAVRVRAVRAVEDRAWVFDRFAAP